MEFKAQELSYSCGANAIKNCLIMYGEKYSEKRIRELAGTTKEGTSAQGIIKCLKQLGYGYKVYQYSNREAFEKNLVKCLDQDRPVIVLTDNCDHWVAVVSRFHRRLVVIDSTFKKIGQEFLISNFSKYAYNYDRKTKKQYYYFIEIVKEV